MASTTALPPPTCTARGRPTTSAGCCFAARPVPAGSSAAVLQGLCRSDRPPAVFACSGLFCRLCLPVHLCHPCLLPSSTFLPPFSFVLLCPLFLPCAPGSVSKTTVCKLQDCPIGSCNTGLQWRPVRRFHLTLTFFPAESKILGHGFSVKL